ncbi:MAG: AAA family ATPase, partial [Cyanobacteriota bacterium]
MFSTRKRYANFGAALSEILIRGFRGIEEVLLVIESPITAISGLNGTGKSTIAQLSTVAYKKPVTESKQYKRQVIPHFFPVSAA